MIFVINEVSLVTALLARATGRRVLVLAVEPLVPMAASALNRLVDRLVAAGVFAPAAADHPELAGYDRDEPEIDFAHVYPRFEPESQAIYRFAELGDGLGDYELIFKNATFSRLKRKLTMADKLHAFFGKAGANATIRGINADVAALVAAMHGGSAGLRPTAGAWHVLANLFLSLVAVGAAAAFAVRKCRPGKAERPYYPLCADIAQEGIREFFLRIADAPGEVMFLCRNDQIMTELDPAEKAKYPHEGVFNGRLSPMQAAAALAGAIRDGALLMRRLYWLPSDCYHQVCKQIYRRVVFRAFFTRYRFGAFLARDEYNTDHITRSQELRRAGIKSLGLSHGMSTGPSVYPHVRYLDFDVFYAFGKRQADAYAATWPKTMAIRTIGSFRATYEQMRRKQDRRTKDIILFANQATDPPAHIAICREIADAFPDRTVYLKFKYYRDYVGAEPHDSYVTGFGAVPGHVVVTTEPPYDLLVRTTYAFSGLSTVVAEALQLGAVSFFIDVYRPDQDIFFRQFSELCVTSAEDAIQRIRALEANRARYDAERFAELIELHEDDFTRQIRADAGLVPADRHAKSHAA
jgi:hypothetical protein